MAKVGGARRGAGRPKGSANKKTCEIANRCAEEGLTPLEVMIDIMRQAYAKGEAGFEMALDAASRAAPFIHPKLSSIDMKTTVKKDIEEYSDAELIDLARQLARSGDSEGAEAPAGPH